MTDFFVCFFPFVKSGERQTKCLPLMMREIMRNSRDHISCAQHLEVTYAFEKIKTLQLCEWCQYKINAYVWWNKLFGPREIANQHFGRKKCFTAVSCKDLWKFLTEAKTFVFVVEQCLDNYKIDNYYVYNV